MEMVIASSAPITRVLPEQARAVAAPSRGAVAGFGALLIALSSTSRSLSQPVTRSRRNSSPISGPCGWRGVRWRAPDSDFSVDGRRTRRSDDGWEPGSSALCWSGRR